MFNRKSLKIQPRNASNRAKDGIVFVRIMAVLVVMKSCSGWLLVDDYALIIA